MSKGTPIPSAVLKEIAEKFDKDIVVMVAWDMKNGQIHGVSYAKKEEHKAGAYNMSKAYVSMAGGDIKQSVEFETLQDNMTTPRIDENWQSKFLNKGTELGCGDLSIMIGTVSEILDKVKDEAHQAGIDKALEICERHKMAFTDLDSKRLRYEKQARNKVLDDTIKALTDNK